MPSPTHTGEPGSTDGLLVLVVEDDDTTRFLYAETLERLGYRTVGARDAEHGLEAALRLHPDVILMDVSMPGMNGIEATQRLKADPRTRDCVVIVVTGGGTATFNQAREAGCDAFFYKPFDPSAIAHVLRSPTAADAKAKSLPQGIVMRCTCGRELTRSQWLGLPLCGRMSLPRRNVVFELRNCECGSSLSLDINELGEAGNTPSEPTHPLEKVFVVDCDPHVRRLVIHFIGDAYVVEFFDDGYAALDRARKSPPCAVIAEIMTPRLDGLALCRLLKADPSTAQVPVLIFSVLAAGERARESGADAFLNKPLEKERFVASLLRLTERREKRAL
jgi:two-component system cell cycle response regulator DivK